MTDSKVGNGSAWLWAILPETYNKMTVAKGDSANLPICHGW